MRDAEWRVVENWLAATNAPLGTAAPVGVLIESQNGDQIPRVEAEMRRAGMEMIKISEKKRWPFRTKWELMARVPRLPMSRTKMDAWLDKVEASIAPYGATVVGWSPLDPGPEELAT
jgi:hypothetical protein